MIIFYKILASIFIIYGVSVFIVNAFRMHTDESEDSLPTSEYKNIDRFRYAVCKFHYTVLIILSFTIASILMGNVHKIKIEKELNEIKQYLIEGDENE